MNVCQFILVYPNLVSGRIWAKSSLNSVQTGSFSLTFVLQPGRADKIFSQRPIFILRYTGRLNKAGFLFYMRRF